MKALTGEMIYLSRCTLKQRLRNWQFISSSIKIALLDNSRMSPTLTTTHKTFHRHAVCMQSNPEKKKISRHQQKVQTSPIEDSPPASNLIHLTVLGSGSSASNASLYVTCSAKSGAHKYFFNCGEGCQRLSAEYKRKLSTLNHIFITSKDWSRVAGLPGVILTVQSVLDYKGVASSPLAIHGPPEINQIFRATERFTNLDNLKIRHVSYLDEKFYEDDVLKVECIPIFKQVNRSDSNNKDDSKPTNTLYNINNPVSGNTTVNPQSYNAESNNGQWNLNEHILCYIGRPFKKKGQLSVSKCFELGVVSSPLLMHLRAGRDIKLKNGEIIRAADVHHPDCPGPVFMVVDCPTEDYIDPLTTSDGWKKYQRDYVAGEGEEKIVPSLIVHFTPEKILLDPRYTAWMESFPPTTEHLLLSGANRSLGSEVVHKLQYSLNAIDKDVFPLLPSQYERESDEVDEEAALMDDVTEAELQDFAESMKFELSELHKPIIQKPKLEIPPQFSHIKVPLTLGETMLKYGIRPYLGYDLSKVVSVKPKSYEYNMCKSPDYLECYETFQREVNALETPSQKQDYPKIVFLGTGSAVPSTTRNVSGILLTTSEDNHILLDCGEGTFTQLVRFYGLEEAKRILVQIKAIFISHLHADHHFGLITFLRVRQAAFNDFDIPFVPVTLVAPHQILYYLASYNKHLVPVMKLFRLVANASFVKGYQGDHPIENREALFNSIDLENLETVRVIHCPNSFAVSLTHKTGWKVTYSGDTMPCMDLVRLGRNSDILIHEATMDDGLLEDARRKFHSTVSEAIGVGKKMNAKFTILTHFSQRYAKIHKIDHIPPNVGIAFDNMQVNMHNLHKLPLMLPMFKHMFAEHFVRFEVSARNRLRNKEQEKKEKKLKREMSY